MKRHATIACLSGAGTAPELMAEAAQALYAVTRLHGLAVDDVHVSFCAAALPLVGQTVPLATRAALLDADAVLLAGADDPSLANVLADLDLRARLTRVRFGGSGDVAFLSPFQPDSAEWTLEEAFKLAERRRLRLTVVGGTEWNELAAEVATAHEDVRVERLSPRDAVPLAAFDPARFDVVAVSDRWAEPVVEIAAAAAKDRVAAQGLLAAHGPSVFLPIADESSVLAGSGVVNPSSMLFAAALVLEHGLGEPSAGATLAGAVSAALVQGQRTAGVRRRGIGASSRQFTERVLAGFQLSFRNAEFLPEHP
jgi:isocitrate/isopropylmalate dehydrogenase